MIRIRERCRTFDIEWDILLGKITTKCQFHCHTRDNATQAVERRAAHAIIGVWQGPVCISDAAFG